MGYFQVLCGDCAETYGLSVQLGKRGPLLLESREQRPHSNGLSQGPWTFPSGRCGCRGNLADEQTLAGWLEPLLSQKSEDESVQHRRTKHAPVPQTKFSRVQ